MSTIKLRQATDEDCEYILRCRNDQDSVRNSLTGRAIPRDEHVAWFNDSRARGTSFHFIAETALIPTPVGCARLDCDHGRFRVSLAVDPEFRAKGYAVEILASVALYAQSRWPDVPLYAEIKRDNIASQIAFRKAGFRPVQEVETVEIR